MSDKVKTLSPKEAYKLLQEHPNAVLIDVRSHMSTFRRASGRGYPHS
jgi:hypothetical protein